MTRTRDEWTAQIIADLHDLWRHLDGTDLRPESASHALGMVKAGCKLIIAEAEPLTVADAMAQAALLLTMVRETVIEARGEAKEPAS